MTAEQNRPAGTGRPATTTTGTRVHDPVPLARALAELLELSDERDQWAQRLGVEYRLGYAIGHALGIEEGRRLEAADRDAAWNRAARPVAVGGVTHDELELRRWGPGGRLRCGDRRPEDRIPRQAGAA